MSTPELEQAIAAARWRGAEKNFLEVISRMLDVDPAIVARVVYAYEVLGDKTLVLNHGSQLTDMIGELQSGGDIPEDARRAIEHAAARAFKRVAIRWRMEEGLNVEVPFDKLVPRTAPMTMCDGCTWRLECVRDGLSTPQKCLQGIAVLAREQPDPKKLRSIQYRYASVKPVKLDDAIVTVEALHPRGTYVVNVLDVRV